MNVRRVISIYERNGEKLLSEYSIAGVSLKEIKEIIKPKKDDPDLYQVYSLEEFELLAFSSFVPDLKGVDLKKVELFYECFSE